MSSLKAQFSNYCYYYYCYCCYYCYYCYYLQATRRTVSGSLSSDRLLESLLLVTFCLAPPTGIGFFEPFLPSSSGEFLFSCLCLWAGFNVCCFSALPNTGFPGSDSFSYCRGRRTWKTISLPSLPLLFPEQPYLWLLPLDDFLLQLAEFSKTGIVTLTPAPHRTFQVCGQPWTLNNPSY